MSTSALPLVCLQYTELEINITFRHWLNYLQSKM